MRSLPQREDVAYVFSREDDATALWPARTGDVAKPRQRDAERVAVKERSAAGA